MRMTKKGMNWLWDLSFGGITNSRRSDALLDTTPMRQLLEKHIQFDRIHQNIEQGTLHAFAVSSTEYATSNNVVFFDGAPSIHAWQKHRRLAIRGQISVDHVMSSAAIPMFFPAVQVAGSYYGDGCLRNSTPLSAAIHLGAKKLFVVGVRSQNPQIYFGKADVRPSTGKVLGILLHAVFLDSVDFDLERLNRINATLQHLTPEGADHVPLTQIHAVMVQPSEDLGHIASKFAKRIPLSLRHIFNALGRNDEIGELLSYLLFDSDYCSTLLELGYKDMLNQPHLITDLLKA